MTKSKRGMVMRGIICLAQDTFPAIARESIFPLLLLGWYIPVDTDFIIE